MGPPLSLRIPGSQCRQIHRTRQIGADISVESTTMTLKLSLAMPLLPRRVGAAFALLVLGACGTYVERKPGIHRGLGEVDPDLLCEYGAPTAMRIAAWSCRKTDKVAAEESRAKEALENMRVFQPRDR